MDKKKLNSDMIMFVMLTISYYFCMIVFFLIFNASYYGTENKTSCMNGVIYGIFIIGGLIIAFSIFYLIMLFLNKSPKTYRLLAAIVPMLILSYFFIKYIQ